MPILFKDRDSDPDSLRSVIAEAIGAASVCWENMEGTGIFDEQRATEILEEVVTWVDDHYAPLLEPVTERLVKKDVIRWFANGDHPKDNVGEWLKDPVGDKMYQRLEGRYVRFFRNPDLTGHFVHNDCGFKWDDHGWIDSGGDGVVVCPGDWIER